MKELFHRIVGAISKMNWLRWILVLPAAIMAYELCSIVISLGFLITDFFWEVNSKNWKDLLAYLACPACFVLCGTKTAPAHKMITGIVLTMLHAIAWAVLATLIYEKFGVPSFSVLLLWRAICVIGGIVVTVMVCSDLHQKEKAEHAIAEREAEASAEFSNDQLPDISKN